MRKKKCSLYTKKITHEAFNTRHWTKMATFIRRRRKKPPCAAKGDRKNMFRVVIECSCMRIGWSKRKRNEGKCPERCQHEHVSGSLPSLTSVIFFNRYYLRVRVQYYSNVLGHARFHSLPLTVVQSKGNLQTLALLLFFFYRANKIQIPVK